MVASVKTRYLDRDGAALAYQVLGDGRVDVLTFYEFMLHLDLCWMDPDTHHNMEDLARFARSAAVQRRGVGLSDRVDYVPSLMQQADDVLAVMDAIGMQRATLVGILGTCGPLALAAAKAPSRVKGLVLLSPIAQGPGVADPVGWSETEAARWLASADHAVAHWGDGALVDLWDPVLATSRNRRLMGLLERSSATPAAARAHYDWLVQIDLQDVFRAVLVPTRVLYTPSSRIPQAAVRHVADLVPNATFHVMPSTSAGASLGQSFAPVAGHVEQLATGSGRPADADRFLGTVLFTDVVSSTELLATVGDAAYRDLRSTHERRVRLAVENYGGSLINVAGDGTLSVFHGPRDAVRCATRITSEALNDGLRVRSGVHSGELERDGLNVTGMTVHIGARVGSAAAAGQVLVSRTVHDLLAGGDIGFSGQGQQMLKGIPGTWELYAVEGSAAASADLVAQKSLQSGWDKLALGAARRAPTVTRAAFRLWNRNQHQRRR